jgi:hypothetical protein
LEWAGVIVAALIAAGWFRPRVGDRWFQAVEGAAARFARRKRLALLTLGLAAVCARLAVLPLQPVPVPVMHDEFSNLLAADTFAHGRLTNPPHPMWVFFDTFHVLQHPTYASKYPPAPGMVLAFGQILGNPWIGTLLSQGAMCMAITWMLQGWMPAPWALLGGVLGLLQLCLFNYWFDGYLGGAVAAVGGALVLGSYPRIMRSGRSRHALLMGTGAVILASSRPLEGFLFCLPIASALAMAFLSSRRLRPRITSRQALLPSIFILGLGLVFLGYYNWRVTGHPLLFPYVLYHREYFNYPFFAWQKMRPPLHFSNPQFEMFFNVWHRTAFRLSWSDWGLRASGAFWAWWYVFLGRPLTISFLGVRRVVGDRRMRLPLVQFLLCAMGLLSVVWFQPHYAAPLAATLFVLLIQALRHLRKFTCHGRPVGIYLTRLAVLLAIDWVVIAAGHSHRYPATPWSANRVRFVEQLQALPGKHLVLVDYAPDHNVHHEWVYNAADIDASRVVWARKIPGQDLRPLLAYFKDRQVWTLLADDSPPRIERYCGPDVGATAAPCGVP